ncbi:MAG: 2-oxo acid dehydrogenase subunit E2 [Microscillaceae bacterium]|nr:2-oxo acid dehydrogenase subunit E2 [Microscillaceae bacterium]MDW8460628.1 dihydrolipoamide acetyltransferase family protein [Cytophagales bacterium]
MALIDMVMPKMGESIMEGTILRWLKKVGDTIQQDEPVLEVATDKVDTEVPATHAGILAEILVKEGEVVPVGKPIARIRTQASTEAQVSDIPLAPSQTEVIEMTEGDSHTTQNYTNGYPKLEKPEENRFYSPLVLSIAKEENISLQELAYVKGTGAENRVTKKDILAYVSYKKQQAHLHKTEPTKPEPAVANKVVVTTTQPKLETPTEVAQVSPAVSYSGSADIIEMDRMRKIIAQRMVDSKRISPHVTTFVEVDVTNLVNWRNKIKDSFKKREGENITFTPIFVQAVAKALRDFPMLNSSVEGDKIIVKKDINIGMATALPSGNLIVPVIKNADHMSLLGLTKKVNDLANRARANKLSPDELANGTYTISNIGPFGNEMGTPIIMQPQVAIMAFGTIKKKPAVIETPEGDFIGIRQMMFISHSYDHRIIDGALGGSFARRVADYLEKFDVNTEV